MSRSVPRAERLAAIATRALARNARRQKRWVALADSAKVNPWSGRPPKGTAERISAARRLTDQSHNGYVRLARAAYDEEHAA